MCDLRVHLSTKTVLRGSEYGTSIILLHLALKNSLGGVQLDGGVLLLVERSEQNDVVTAVPRTTGSKGILSVEVPAWGNSEHNKYKKESGRNGVTLQMKCNTMATSQSVHLQVRSTHISREAGSILDHPPFF